MSAPWARAFLVLSVATCLAYAPAMDGPLQFDDRHLFQDSAPVQAFRAGRPVEIHSPYPRGWVDAACLFDIAFWGDPAGPGIEPWGLHATNLCLHLLNGWLVLWIVDGILRARGIACAREFAVAAAGGFLLHPIQVQSVAYLSGRSELLAAMSVLLSSLPWARRIWSPARRIGWTCAWTAAGLCAKESAMAAPALAVVAAWAARDGRGAARMAVATAVLGGAAWVLGAGTHFLAHLRTLGGAGVAYDWYVPTEVEVLPRYAAMAAWPARHVLDADIPYSLWTVEPDRPAGWVRLLARAAEGVGAVRFRGAPDSGEARTAWRADWWLGAAGVVGALVAVAALHRCAPLLAGGTGWFLVALGPTLAIPLQDVWFEHRAYAALPGLLLAVVAGAAVAGRSRRAGLVAAGVCLAALTAARAAVWDDREELWANAALESPRKSRVQNNLGREYAGVGRHGRARRAYERALANSRHLFGVELIYENLARCLRAEGDPAGAARVLARGAERPIPDEQRRSFLRLGAVLWTEAGQSMQAAAMLRRLVDDLASPVAGEDALRARMRERIEARVSLADALRAAGALDGARAEIDLALSLDPDWAPARTALGRVQVAEGDLAGAKESFLEALRLDPDDAPARMNLAVLLRREGDLPRALAEMRAAHAGAPGDAEIAYELGDLLREAGRAAEGVPHLEAAVSGRAGDPAVRVALALALRAARDREAGIASLRRAVDDRVWNIASRDLLAAWLDEAGDADGAAAVRALPDAPPGAGP